MTCRWPTSRSRSTSGATDRATSSVGCITRGYQSGETAILAVFEYSFLITASFWAWVVWGQQLDALGYPGIAMIVGSGAIVARGAATPAPPRGAASDAA